MAVYGPAQGAVNQGDVRSGVTFHNRQEHSSELVVALGLVVSHSCDIDKYDEVKHSLTNAQKKRWPVGVAPLYGLTGLDTATQGDVRRGRHRRYFYLPREDPHHEMVADLWLIQPVPLLLIRRQPRLATLSPQHLAKLWSHMFVTTSRKEPNDVFVGGQLAP